MDLIADTNIWYDIAAGRISVPEIKQDGQNRLCATPINILEIVSNVSNHQFDRRRNAIISLVEHSDLILDDTEIHLTHLWGNSSIQNPINWRDVLVAVQNASNLDHLRGGVLDFAERVTRRVNVNFAHFWRTSQWAGFRVDIENVLDEHSPGYAEARQNGRMIHFDQEHSIEFRNILFNEIVLNEILNATYDRANLVLQDIGQSLPPEARDDSLNNSIRQNACTALQPYIRAYAQYLFSCGTVYAPRDNDWGDLEHFIYLQGDNRLFTNDIRWINIARDSGNEQWLFVL